MTWTLSMGEIIFSFEDPFISIVVGDINKKTPNQKIKHNIAFSCEVILIEYDDEYDAIATALTCSANLAMNLRKESLSYPQHL
jgi:hypothetical protein